jgi:hypothetical protein
VSLHRLFRLLIPILILLGAPVFAQDAAAPARLKVHASGGFSGWAVPLPDYAAHVVMRGEIVGGSARMVYGDVSLTPLRVEISGNAAEMPCTVVINDRATTLRLPEAGAFIAELSAETPEDDTPDTCASLVQRFDVTVPAGGGTFWFPVQIYPQPSDLASSAVEVEVQSAASAPVKSSATFRYFPRGRMYVCLLEANARGALAAEDIGQVVAKRPVADKAISGFNQQLQLISTAPEDIGPDYRVLRHFAYIAVSAEEWRAMPDRVKDIIADAAAHGGRLVIFGASGAATVGKHIIEPLSTFELAPFSYGDVAVTSLPLAEARKLMSGMLLQRLRWAHNLGLGFASNEVGQDALRDFLYRAALGEASQYGWMIGASDVAPGIRSVNPAWVYDYFTRAGLLHPLDSREYHWQSVGLEDVSRELVDMSASQRESRPIHWVIDYNLRRFSARALSNSAIAFTLLIIVIAAGCFARKYRYIVLAAVMLVVSAAAIGVYALRIDAYLLGSINGLELTSTIASADTETSEVRAVGYVYSSYATDCAVVNAADQAVLTRISPLQDDMVETSSGRGTFSIGKLHIEPLLPTEFSATYIQRQAPPLQGSVTKLAADEELLELKCGSEPLSFVFLVDGTRVLFIGDVPANASRTIVVPTLDIQRIQDTELAVRVARGALSSLYNTIGDSAYAGDPSGLRSLGLTSQAEVICAEVLRQLVADGRGITLVGLRAGESNLRFGRNTGQVPKIDLFTYKLK